MAHRSARSSFRRPSGVFWNGGFNECESLAEVRLAEGLNDIGTTAFTLRQTLRSKIWRTGNAAHSQVGSFVPGKPAGLWLCGCGDFSYALDQLHP